LAFIENRFLSIDKDGTGGQGDHKRHQHLTLRDEHASTLEDLFDFDESPSLNTAIGQAQPPVADCTPQ
jgi:hypothetical protein